MAGQGIQDAQLPLLWDRHIIVLYYLQVLKRIFYAGLSFFLTVAGSIYFTNKF